MSKPSIITRKLTDLKPDLKNANKGTERGLRMLDDSLSEDGAGRGILLDRNNNVIAGNKTLERAVDQGFTEIVIVPTDGKQLVATQRIDVDIDSVQGRRMALRDNRVGQVDLEFDGDVLRELADEGVDLSALWTEDELAELIGEDVTGATDPGAQVDKAEELQAKWQVKPGDLYMVPGLVPHAVGAPVDDVHILAAFGSPHMPVDSPGRMALCDWDGSLVQSAIYAD